jgi:hypothetical protein
LCGRVPAHHQVRAQQTWVTLKRRGGGGEKGRRGEGEKGRREGKGRGRKGEWRGGEKREKGQRGFGVPGAWAGQQARGRGQARVDSERGAALALGPCWSLLQRRGPPLRYTTIEHRWRRRERGRLMHTANATVHAGSAYGGSGGGIEHTYERKIQHQSTSKVSPCKACIQLSIHWPYPTHRPSPRRQHPRVVRGL